MRENTPSDIRADELGFARVVGFVGLLVLFLAGIALFLTQRPFTSPSVVVQAISPTWAIAGIAAAIAMLLYHSLRDGDRQVRNLYLGLGALLAVVGLVGLIFSLRLDFFSGRTGGAETANQFYARLAFIVGLGLGAPFLLTAGRHETDARLTQALTYALFIIGLVLAVGGLTVSQFDERFLNSHGMIMAVLGLVYLSALCLLTGTDSDLGHRVAQLMGLIGAAAFLYALARSTLPAFAYYMAWTANPPDAYFARFGIMTMAVSLVYLLIAIGIVSEAKLVVLIRREMISFFFSPIAYIVLGVMAVVGWMWYLTSLVGFINQAAMRNSIILEPLMSANPGAGVLTILPVFAVMLVVPAITMRTLSEEQKSATLEMLLTAPVTELQIVLGKFFASLMVFMILVIPWALYLVSLRIEGGVPFDTRPLITFGLALLCTGAALISMGVFFSSLTRDQIVSFALTAMGIIAFLAVYFISNQSILPPTLQSIADRLSFVSVWIEALGGKLSIRDSLTYISLTILWLFMTTKVLESRKWR